MIAGKPEKETRQLFRNKEGKPVLKLLEPIKIGKLDLKNRVVMAPMCMYEARQQDGMLTDFHKVHYGARALGGVGLIMVEATGIDPAGRISPYDLGLWQEGQAHKLKDLTDLLHGFGAKVGIQISHAGRKARGGGQLLGPSALAFSPDYDRPLAMTQAQIDQVIGHFRQAAAYANQAGFDALELHGAHGYLLNQFLSPLSNHRQDQYGGSLENRYRLLGQVVEAVKPVFSGALWVRLSAHEYDPAGLSMADFIQISRWLKDQGVEVVDVSSGGVVNKGPDRIYPGYQVALASQIKQGAGIPVAAVGLLNDAKLAEYILQTGQADLICLARPLLANPNWLQEAARLLGKPDDFQAYNTSYQRGKTI